MITLKEYKKIEQEANEFFNRFKNDFIKCGLSQEDVYHELIVDLLEGQKNKISLNEEYVRKCLDNILLNAKNYNKVFVER